MNDLYILGGEMRLDAARKEEWQHFQNAVVVKVDMEARRPALIHEYFRRRRCAPTCHPLFLRPVRWKGTDSIPVRKRK